MKKFLRFLVLVLVLSISFIFSVFAGPNPVVTVLDFSTNNISEADMKSVVSFLSSSIYDLGIFDVIDTGQRDMILSELNFSNSGCSDETCQLEIGKLLSAEYIVIGDIGKIGERYMLTTRLLETETSKAVGNAKGIYKDINEFIDSLHLIAEDLGSKYLAGLEDEMPASDDNPIIESAQNVKDEEPEPVEPQPAEQEIAETDDKDIEEKTPLPVKPAPKETSLQTEDDNIVTPIAFISGAVCGAASIGSYIYSSIKYQEYTVASTIADAEVLHSEVELFDTIAISSAAAAGVGLITGVISWLFF